MLSSRRVVSVGEVESLKGKKRITELLLRYLERPAQDTVLILVQGPGEEAADPALAAATCAVSCNPLTREAVMEWLRGRAAELGIGFRDEAAEHLAHAAGDDLGALQAELLKLASLGQQEPFEVEQIGYYVGVRRGETLSHWRKAVLDRETARALELTEPVLAQAGVTAVRMLTALGSALIGIGLARALHDRGVRGPALTSEVLSGLTRRVKPFWLKDSWGTEAGDWTTWAERWTPPQLTRGVTAALAADRALKSARVSDEGEVLKDLILQLALPHRQAA
jgi:DNA polymerase III delta subunit